MAMDIWCLILRYFISNIVNISLLCNGPSSSSFPPQACNGILFDSIKSSIVNITSGYKMTNSNFTIRTVDYFLIDTIGSNVLSQNNFDIYDTAKVFISCFEDGSCSYLNIFNIYDNSNITWYCGYGEGKDNSANNWNDPCSSSTLNAPNANSIDVIMNSWGSNAISIIGPPHSNYTSKSNVKCIYSGCQQMAYSSRNGLIDWNITFGFDSWDSDLCYDYGTCSKFGSNGNSMDSCIWSWIFNCGLPPFYRQSGQYSPDTSLVYTGQCGNNDTFDAIESQFNSAYNDATGNCWYDWDLTGWEIAGMIGVGFIFCCGGLAMCWWCSFRKKRKYAKYPTLI